MKRKTHVGNLLASLWAVGIVLYVMGKTTSSKIVLVPFLICALAMAGKSIAQLAGKEKIAAAVHKVFVAGFLLFGLASWRWRDILSSVIRITAF